MTDDDSVTLETAFASVFFKTGIPFRVADADSVTTFLAKLRPAWKPPSSKVVRTRLLDEAIARHDRWIKTTVDAYDRVSVVTDGWSNLNGEHLVNFVLIFGDGAQRPILYKTISTADISQTGVNVAKAIQDVLDEIGPAKVSGVVTDNAANMKAAWKILEDDNKGLICNGCAAHAFNLLIKDVCSLPTSSVLLEKTRIITNFVRSRTAVLARFKALQATAQQLGETDHCRGLRTIVATRWYSQHISAERILDNKYSLVSLATSTFLDVYSETSATARSATTSFQAIVGDDQFWSDMAAFVATLRPTTRWVAVLESETGQASDVYRAFMALKVAWADNKTLSNLVARRWAFLHTEAMGVAYFLDTKTRAGDDMVGTDQQGTMSQIVKLVATKGLGKKHRATKELDDYVNLFSTNQPTIAQLLVDQASATFWATYGKKKFPILYKMYLTVNAVPTSQAAAERVWSVYNFMHNKRRNRLKHTTVTSLVKLFYNGGEKADLVERFMGNETDTDSGDDGQGESESKSDGES
jgi:hypothetical protein